MPGAWRTSATVFMSIFYQLLTRWLLRRSRKGNGSDPKRDARMAALSEVVMAQQALIERLKSAAETRREHHLKRKRKIQELERMETVILYAQRHEAGRRAVIGRRGYGRCYCSASSQTGLKVARACSLCVAQCLWPALNFS